jgi:hypothetical protein
MKWKGRDRYYGGYKKGFYGTWNISHDVEVKKIYYLPQTTTHNQCTIGVMLIIIRKKRMF